MCVCVCCVVRLRGAGASAPLITNEQCTIASVICIVASGDGFSAVGGRGVATRQWGRARGRAQVGSRWTVIGLGCSLEECGRCCDMANRRFGYAGTNAVLSNTRLSCMPLQLSYAGLLLHITFAKYCVKCEVTLMTDGCG